MIFKWLCTVLVFTIGLSPVVHAQDYVELGVAEALRSRKNNVNFLPGHGAFLHVGYDFEPISIHLKAYSGRTTYNAMSEHGFGIGFSHIIFPNINPRLRSDIGIGFLYVHKRNTSTSHFDNNFASAFLESKIRYRFYRQLYACTEFSFGYSRRKYVRGDSWRWSGVDMPYFFSFGIGYQFHQK